MQTPWMGPRVWPTSVLVPNDRLSTIARHKLLDNTLPTRIRFFLTRVVLITLEKYGTEAVGAG
jgi:hypothetical protein